MVNCREYDESNIQLETQYLEQLNCINYKFANVHLKRTTYNAICKVTPDRHFRSYLLNCNYLLFIVTQFNDLVWVENILKRVPIHIENNNLREINRDVSKKSVFKSSMVKIY